MLICKRAGRCSTEQRNGTGMVSRANPRSPQRTKRTPQLAEALLRLGLSSAIPYMLE